MDQYLYRLFGADGTLLYTGVSDDWTRRLRQHWLGKHWSAEILGVALETYPDRLAVLAAERKAIRAESPLYNIQHNHRPAIDEPDSTLTAADVLLTAALLIAAGFIIYELAQVGIEKYRTWKADREQFREWQRARVAGDDLSGRDGNDSATSTIPPSVMTQPPTPSPANCRHDQLQRPPSMPNSIWGQQETPDR